MNTVQLKMFIIDALGQSLKLEEVEETKDYAQWAFDWVMEDAEIASSDPPVTLHPVN